MRPTAAQEPAAAGYGPGAGELAEPRQPHQSPQEVAVPVLAAGQGLTQRIQAHSAQAERYAPGSSRYPSSPMSRSA
jgi:hypothetical protein